ncbi:hypothetical protein M9458_035369, partial [Cirrhinus mrigala]
IAQSLIWYLRMDLTSGLRVQLERSVCLSRSCITHVSALSQKENQSSSIATPNCWE